MITGRLLVVAALTSVSGACGQRSRGAGDAGDDGGNSPVAASAFCDAYAAVLCDGDQSCCTDATMRFPSRDMCIASLTSACQNGVGHTVIDPRTAYNPQRGADLLAAIRARTQSCSVDPAYYPSDWLGLFDGTVPAGGDCTPANFYDQTPLFTCLRGNTCSASSTMIGRRTCAPLAGAGNLCSSPYGCLPGLECGSTSMICRAYVGDGQTCSAYYDCRTQWCDGLTGLCRAATPNERYCLFLGGP